MKRKRLISKIIITLAICIYAVILYTIKPDCIIRKYTGIPCPGCGLTRAMESAISLDFKSAFSHHPLFWSVPVLFLSFLFDGRLFKNNTLNLIVHLAIAAGFIVNWLFVIFTN